MLLGKRLALLSRHCAPVLQATHATSSGNDRRLRHRSKGGTVTPFQQTEELPRAQRTVRSLLFPMSMMVMLGFACCRASSSQLARWLKVSRLRRASQSYRADSVRMRRMMMAPINASGRVSPADMRCRDRQAHAGRLGSGRRAECSPRDVIHQQGSSCATVVRPRD